MLRCLLPVASHASEDYIWFSPEKLRVVACPSDVLSEPSKTLHRFAKHNPRTRETGRCFLYVGGDQELITGNYGVLHITFEEFLLFLQV